MEKVGKKKEILNPVPSSFKGKMNAMNSSNELVTLDQQRKMTMCQSKVKSPLLIVRSSIFFKKCSTKAAHLLDGAPDFVVTCS